jgi:Right handed beta helix region
MARAWPFPKTNTPSSLLLVLAVTTAILSASVMPASRPAVAAATPPTPDVTAGARQLPDRGFLTATNAASQVCDYYVDQTRGAPGNPGTQDQPWATVHQAIAHIQATAPAQGPGKAICVYAEQPQGAPAPTTYTGPGMTISKSGTAAAPYVLRRAPTATARPVLRLNQATPLLRIEGQYWVVEGLELDLADQRTTGLVLQGRYLALRHSFVHDDARGAAVYVNGQDVTVEGGVIADNFHFAGEDSHGVNIVADAQRVLVRQVTIRDNGGDGVQCEYTGSPDDPAAPRDITIEDNRIETTDANLGRIEQAIDIKTCDRVSIRGSVPPDRNDPLAAGQKLLNFRTAATGGRPDAGGAIVVHYGARGVLVENNRLFRSCHGIAIGRTDVAVTNMVIRRNAIFDMRSGQGNCRGRGLQLQRVEGLEVYHNTFDALAGAALWIDPGAGHTAKNVEQWNNIVRDAAWFLDIRVGKLSGFASDHNVFWDAPPNPNQQRFLVDGQPLDISAWRQKATGSAILAADGNGRVDDPRFVPGAPAFTDYYTLADPNSPVRDRALRNVSSYFAGAGPDIGFRETYDANADTCMLSVAGSWWPSEPFATQTGRFTAEVDAIPSAAPVDAAVGLSGGPATGWPGLAAIVRFNPAGRIDARNGGQYVSESQIPYAAGQRYRLRLAVDVAARRYSGWVTAPGATETRIGDNLAFRTEQQTVTSLRHAVTASAVGSLTACNLRVTPSGA